MIDLTSLLKRFKNSLSGDEERKNLVIESVRGLCLFDMQIENVNFRGDGIELALTPVQKAQVKLKEQALISLINHRTGLNLYRIFYK